MGITFNLNLTKNEQIEALIKKAYDGQWYPEDRINWKQEIILPDGLELYDYRDMVSQLFYTEIYTVNLCQKMYQTMKHFQFGHFLATQILDEMRHADIYKTYAQKVGGLVPIHKKMKMLFNEVFNWEGHPLGQVLAINVLLEGEALNQQKKRIETLPCPLFKQINEEIMKDESRHNAFGILYTKAIFNEVDKKERDQIFSWLKGIWCGWEEANENRYQSKNGKILQTGKDELEGRWADNLKKIGNIPGLEEYL